MACPIGKGEKIGAFALSEPNIGSDANHIETSYAKNGSSYVINGRKKWISFNAIADFFWL
ncbi:acyl-CoA dehydrogenase family protein [Bacillus stercoris]|nr:acyl-CoA dehydrogenase family protein [Bacillus stercoris]